MTKMADVFPLLPVEWTDICNNLGTDERVAVARAINSHDALVEALADMINGIDAEFGQWRTDVNFPKARTALSIAQGNAP
jgi:hypothetical protein